jgi:hypothetical protein
MFPSDEDLKALGISAEGIQCDHFFDHYPDTGGRSARFCFLTRALSRVNIPTRMPVCNGWALSGLGLNVSGFRISSHNGWKLLAE